MAAQETIVEILEKTAPKLELVPDWAPVPDPVQPSGPLARFSWEDIWDKAKSGYTYIFRGGNQFSQTSQEQLQQAVDAAVGETIKTLSGFIDQNAAMTVQAAQILETFIGNVERNAIYDQRILSQRIDALEAGQEFIARVVVPVIRSEIAAAEARATNEAHLAQQNAIDWGLHNIFAPLYSEMLKVQPAINEGVAKAERNAHLDAQAQVSVLASAVGVAITPMRAALQALKQFNDECATPMCDTMGPKTDLGKLLKGLKTAQYLALIAALAAMSKGDVENLIRSIAHMSNGLLDHLDDFLVGGSGTLGGTLADAGG